MPRQRISFVWLLSLAAMMSVVGCGAPTTSTPATLSAQDQRDIRALDSAYVTAWLRDDTAAVLATLARDAVLMPAGHAPLTNREAIRAFWWPRDGSRTRVTAFARQIEELGGNEDLAYVRGSDSLAFTYEKDTTRLQQRIVSTTLGLLRRDANGRWRVSRMMWYARSP